MDTKEKIINRCFGQFSRIIYKSAELQKQSRDYGTGEKLYSSEIHAIEAIGNSPGSSISDLARTQGITRGAVQQLSAKLESRGYIKRIRSGKDRKRIFLELTEKGTLAHQGHHDFHKEMFSSILNHLGRFNKNELEKTIDIFSLIENNFDSYLDTGNGKEHGEKK